MGSSGRPQQAIQRLPDSILQLLFPPEQAGFLGHLAAYGVTTVHRILPGENQRPAPGDRLLDSVPFPVAAPVPPADGDACPTRDQGHRGDVKNLFYDRSRHRGQPCVDVQDRRNGEGRGELQGEAEKKNRRDDAGPGDRRNGSVDLHGRGASPGEKGQPVGDAISPSPIEKTGGEEVRGRERSDRGEKEKRNPSRDPLLEKEEGKEVQRRGKPCDVPEALQSVTAAGH